MATFKKFNGKSGFDAIFHTSTGYRCLSKNVSTDDLGKKIFFFAKHVVGKDGKPYTEIGFESDEIFNKKETLEKVKQLLVKSGYSEVYALSNCRKDEKVFSLHATPYPNSIELRVNASVDGIILVFNALQELISPDAVNFVNEQEQNLEETLFNSIMDSMGDELKKGPGGEAKAIAKAKELSRYFIEGISN